jgi:hypothetical protein
MRKHWRPRLSATAKAGSSSLPLCSTVAPVYRTPHVLWRLNSSGSLATFAAIRHASAFVSNLAAQKVKVSVDLVVLDREKL